MSHCVFCDIVAGDAPAQIIERTPETVAFMDINPASDGHLLVVPVRHVRDIWDATGDEHAAMGRAAHRLAQLVRDALMPDGLNLLQCNGAAAFQSVFHLHTHVIPRWRSDGLEPPWIPTPGDPERIATVAERLRAAR